MKNALKITIFALLFFVFVPLMSREILAASLSFDQTTVSVSNGGTFQIAVKLDPSPDSVSSSDIYVNYDATALKATAVSAGTLFPTVTNDISTSGKVYIAGLVNDTASSVSSAGTVATITFQALKESTVTLTFDCASSKVVKNDVNATNVLNCSSNGTSSVTIGTGSSGTTNPTPTSGTLPQSGVFDNVVKFAVPGAILLFLGSALRLVL
ncbi:cohesin domain-containing protein [Patescibacteria group bacterium]|nr:cohesin domain-containing protein [Patescibacteria group bacterium]